LSPVLVLRAQRLAGLPQAGALFHQVRGDGTDRCIDAGRSVRETNGNAAAVSRGMGRGMNPS
jgi:hypothetical protein